MARLEMMPERDRNQGMQRRGNATAGLGGWLRSFRAISMIPVFGEGGHDYYPAKPPKSPRFAFTEEDRQWLIGFDEKIRELDRQREEELASMSFWERKRRREVEKRYDELRAPLWSEYHQRHYDAALRGSRRQ